MLLLRLLLVAIVLGTSLAIAATGTVSLELVAATTVSWSFVVGVQLVAALAILGPARNRTMSLAHALDDFFSLHVPWSMWLIAWALFNWLTSPIARSNWILASAAAPLAATSVLIYRFCRQELGDQHRRAVLRTVVHQAIVWTCFLLVGGAAVGLWPRLLWMVPR